MIKEIIVVEGKDDTVAVRRAVEADTIETGGSALGDDVLNRIRLAQQTRGVIVLTDPDYPGERIRHIIRQTVTGCKHAFIPRKYATKDGKVGVEHASPAVIREALSRVRAETMDQPLTNSITWSDFVASGLTAHSDARKRRQFVGEKLGIGYANARGLYDRIRAFCVSVDEFEAVIERLNEEERDESSTKRTSYRTDRKSFT